MTNELLVHISAPTTRQSDELYQSLADAYLEFEPLQTNPEDVRRTDASNKPALSMLNNPPAAETGSFFYGTADTSFLSTSKDSYGSFPSHLSSENVKSTAGAITQSYSDAAEEDLPPSSSRLAQLERIHRNGEGRRILRSSSAAGGRIANQIPSSPDDADTGFIEDTQLAVHDLQSQLQDSFSMISDDTSEDNSHGEKTQDDLQAVAEQDEPTDESVTEVLVTATPYKSEAVPERRRSMRLKGANSVAEEPETSFSKPSTRASSAIAKAQEVQPENTPQASTPRPKITKGGPTTTPGSVQLTQPIDFAKLQIEVYPPEPKVSTEQPGTLPCQITPALAAIKAKDPTSFKPIKTSKEPKPDDRGHWLINCSNWTTQLQQTFWNDTCEQIASGQLGWGVTLYREGGTARALGKVKLYCWGEVVEHMWLALCLYSKGAASGCGSRWIDADGNAAFVMP